MFVATIRRCSKPLRNCTSNRDVATAGVQGEDHSGTSNLVETVSELSLQDGLVGFEQNSGPLR